MNYQMNIEAIANRLYDLSFIDKICRNNSEMKRKMLLTFISTIPVAVEQIKNAYERLEYTVINKTAHQIKPVLAFYAIVTMEKDIKLIEQLAKEEKNTTELQLKIQKLDVVISQVVSDLKTNLLNN